MSNEDKTSDITISKWKYYAMILGIVVTVLTIAYKLIAASMLTFDDQKQKSEMVEGTFRPGEKTDLQYKVNDLQRHMTVDEKNTILLMSERIMRLDQDQRVVKDDVVVIHRILRDLDSRIK